MARCPGHITGLTPWAIMQVIIQDMNTLAALSSQTAYQSHRLFKLTEGATCINQQSSLPFHYVILRRAGHVAVCRNIMSVTLVFLLCSSFSFLLNLMSFAFAAFLEGGSVQGKKSSLAFFVLSQEVKQKPFTHSLMRRLHPDCFARHDCECNAMQFKALAIYEQMKQN